MHRTACALFLTLTLVVLAGCGAADGDRLVLVDDPAGVLLDDEVMTALNAAGVTALLAPAAEDPALVELGQALFFDKLLSGNENISCATCHHPVAGTGDALPVSLGEGGIGLGANREQAASALIPRNAPHLFNGGVPGVDAMFWDSRVTRNASTGELDTPEPGLNGAAPTLLDHAAPLTSALAAQAMFPVTSREEMRGQIDGGNADDLRDAATNADVWSALMARIVGTSDGTVGGFDGYRALFDAAYPSITNYDDLTFGHAARAIAAFERETWTALDSPFDRFLGGDASAMSDSAKRGAKLFFGAASCSTCHNGPFLSDFQHHAVCVPQVGPGKNAPSEDLGLSLETGDSADDYKFRTPTLRNVALTAPYMHDGAFMTLEEVVRHHLDPQASLAAYDGSLLPDLFAATLDTDAGRNAARAAALSPLHPTSVVLTDDEFDDLMAFLHALTDPSSVSLLDEVPDEVPSGLPVKD